MAIQKINLGTEPLGEGGDTYRSANTKINENFSNTAHAASRLVGVASSNLMEVGAFGMGSHGIRDSGNVITPNVTTQTGIYKNSGDSAAIYIQWNRDNYAWGLTLNGSNINHVEWFKGAPVKENKIYTSGNTTKDVATGFLKASSPVLHVYNNSITKIHEAEQLDIKVNKKGVGHYEIHGTTGLRKNDGWFMSPPRDMHSNVLCMVDYEEKDGVIILKTYKKKFDFETVSIVHDYDNPMDIPDGACVEFRFNDLPEDVTDKSTSETESK